MYDDIKPTQDEARAAELALCRLHGSRFEHLNIEGKLYYCPQGHYWRHTRGRGMHAPLQWPRGL